MRLMWRWLQPESAQAQRNRRQIWSGCYSEKLHGHQFGRYQCKHHSQPFGLLSFRSVQSGWVWQWIGRMLRKVSTAVGRWKWKTWNWQQDRRHSYNSCPSQRRKLPALRTPLDLYGGWVATTSYKLIIYDKIYSLYRQQLGHLRRWQRCNGLWCAGNLCELRWCEYFGLGTQHNSRIGAGGLTCWGARSPWKLNMQPRRLEHKRIEYYSQWEIHCTSFFYKYSFKFIQ